MNMFGLQSAAQAPRIAAPARLASAAGGAAGGAGGIMSLLSGANPWGMAAGMGAGLLGNIFKGLAGENKIAKRMRKEQANVVEEQRKMANLERALAGEEAQRRRSIDPLAGQSLQFLMNRLQGGSVGQQGTLMRQRDPRASTLPPALQRLVGGG